MSIIHTLSASALHGLNEGPNGTNRSHLVSCLAKLNPQHFARPHAVASLNATKSAVGDPLIAPIDALTIKSSVCRESMFAEHEAIKQQQRLEEIAAMGMGGIVGDEVELATTMRRQQKDRNPFSGFVESKLRRFACTAFNGYVIAPEIVNAATGETSDVGSLAHVKLSPFALTIPNRPNVFYRSPWSSLSQSVIDIPSMTRALCEESDGGGSNSSGGGGDASTRQPHPYCPIVAAYQTEAMALFSNKQLSQHRQITESFSTAERCVSAREVEAQLNAMLNSYLDAYYCAAVEIPMPVNTSSLGGERRLGPAPMNNYGETIKTTARPADHDLVASAFVRDYGFERAGQPRQYFLEVNAVIRNRVKVDGAEEWRLEMEGVPNSSPQNATNSGSTAAAASGGGSSSSSVGIGGLKSLPLQSQKSGSNKASQAKPPHRSWTTVHTAVVRQHNREVKVSMASRLVVKQTSRAPTATSVPIPDPSSSCPTDCSSSAGPANDKLAYDLRRIQSNSQLKSSRGAASSSLGDGGSMSFLDADDMGLDVDPIAIYGYGDGSLTGDSVRAAGGATSYTDALLTTARTGRLSAGSSSSAFRGVGGGDAHQNSNAYCVPYPNLVVDTEAALSHASWTSSVFQVGKDDDALVVQPRGIAQIIGDGIQNVENEAFVPLLLDVLSNNTATLIRSVVRSTSSARAAASKSKLKKKKREEKDGDGERGERNEVLVAQGEKASHHGLSSPSASSEGEEDAVPIEAPVAATLPLNLETMLETSDDRAIALRFPIGTGCPSVLSQHRAAAMEASAMCAAVRGAAAKGGR